MNYKGGKDVRCLSDCWSFILSLFSTYIVKYIYEILLFVIYSSVFVDCSWQ